MPRFIKILAIAERDDGVCLFGYFHVATNLILVPQVVRINKGNIIARGFRHGKIPQIRKPPDARIPEILNARIVKRANDRQKIFGRAVINHDHFMHRVSLRKNGLNALAQHLLAVVTYGERTDFWLRFHFTES